MQKLVIFGAGKIGRSFIGQLFSRSGYEVVFIDIDKGIVDALNEQKCYKVVIKAAKKEVLKIQNVRGVLAEDLDTVSEEIATASVAALSVGKNALPHVIPLLARGLEKRFSEPENTPLDIILAENMRDAAGFVRNQLNVLLPSGFDWQPKVGLVETSIGKMVPIMREQDTAKDPLWVFAEPYNTLILDKKAFKNPIPRVKGLAPKDNMKAWVDRKSFVHNLGHAATAYFGYCRNPEWVFLYEVLTDAEIYQRVRQTMQQAAEILYVHYPDEFTRQALNEHIDDLIERFKSRALGDTVFRVGCDLPRKLGYNDRLVGAIRMGLQHKLPIEKITQALFCGFHFRATDQNGQLHPADKEVAEVLQLGARYILKTVCGLTPEKHSPVFKTISKLSKADFN